MNNVKVLVVEDIVINRLVIRQYFQNHDNISVEEASNGQEAVEMVQSRHYDVVLMDIRMPIMDGTQATSIIRQLQDARVRNIPIIALTANITDDFLDDTEDGYFTDIVTKPFNAQELRDKVLQCVGENHESYVRQKLNADYAVSYIDYERIEQSFQHDKIRIAHFYGVVEDALREYEEELVQAIGKKDEDDIENVGHKAGLTLKTLFFEELQAVIHSIPLALQECDTEEKLQELIKQTRYQFEAGLRNVQKRKSKVQQGA